MTAGAAETQAEIRWPSEFAPERSAVHVRNELAMPVPVGAVWAWLLRAEQWPSWYPNSARVRLLEAPSPDLSLGARFHWWTFGVPITSEVVELVPEERIAWTAQGVGVRAYHAWLLRPLGAGCSVLTEETQSGWAAKLGAWAFPRRMRQQHQIWLERLARQAALGRPPPGRQPGATKE